MEQKSVYSTSHSIRNFKGGGNKTSLQLTAIMSISRLFKLFALFNMGEVPDDWIDTNGFETKIKNGRLTDAY